MLNSSRFTRPTMSSVWRGRVNLIQRLKNRKSPTQFMPAYDIDNSDGSARLNWMKAALLPNWRETFKTVDRNSRGKAS